LIVQHATDYIKRQAAADTPFFTYVGLSHMHPPEAVHPAFDQTSPERLGQYADLIAEMDYRVGQILDCIQEAGITDNTLVVFSSDNAAGDIPAFQGGSNGPFRGSFMTPPWEGSMRVPAMVRWPGKVPAGVITEEMLSAHDWYTTFAALAGASDRVPTDRPIDGIDASRFLLGESPTSGRESILFFGPDGGLMSVKWHNLKVILRYSEGMDQPIVTPQWPMLFDLGSDPGELYNVFADKMDMGWMLGIALKFVADYEKSIAEYPNIKTGAEFTGYE
jgi:arylsulfatase